MKAPRDVMRVLTRSASGLHASLVPALPEELRPAFKDSDSWWTVLVIDPIAARVLPGLLRRPWVTPNRLTALSGVVGLASGAAFLDDRPRAGAVLFETRFLLDCLDGKVARMRDEKSGYGHFMDLATDFVGTTWATATFGVWLARRGAVRPEAALVPLAAKVIWAWSQSERYSFAPPEPRSVSTPVRDDADWRGVLVGGLQRRRLTRLPSSIEAETLVLFLGPLTGSPRVARAASYVAIGGFFAPSVMQNLVRTARALRQADRAHGAGS